MLLEYLSNVPHNSGTKPSAIAFEKDDPTNYHIEFMGGVANLRVNYTLFRQETIASTK